ncbi:MAG: lipoyl synthase [Candidatus Caenarcaniphilales bacterium]|nr:lipoyl synthase [Candidatus Caenarcaniphilales bacterium]
MFDESRNPFTVDKEKLPRLPKWLRNSIPKFKFDELIEKMPLNGMTTVCKEAMCPNRGECISRGIVTVMILGSECTRGCTFCAVDRNEPLPVDPDEPQKMLDMVNYMDPLKYIVITAPTRDDLFDGGASQFRTVTEHIKVHRPDVKLELLIPDFQNQDFAFDEIIAAKPDMLCFDIQTVKELYKWVRPGFSYDKALELFSYFKEKAPDLNLKSGIMLGLGERKEEIVNLMQELYQHGVRYITLGQYLKPPEMKLPVIEYVPEDSYEYYREQAKKIGLWIQASPLTRSSYLADQFFEDSEAKEAKTNAKSHA